VETDEVYAQMTLQPVNTVSHDVCMSPAKQLGFAGRFIIIFQF